jgi:protein-disulfide isomerase
MKKSYVWGGAVILAILVVALLTVKMIWQNEPVENVKSGEVVAEDSFIPTNQPQISGKDKIIGSAKAPVKIVVYEDYSNIFSADNAEVLKKVESDFGKKVAIAVRPYATREKAISLEAAMAVECGGDQGKWAEMRDGIFRVVKINNLNDNGINGWAKQIGLDQSEFSKCLTNVEKQGIMLRVAEDAKQFSVYGAPTIFVNDELVVGARPYDDYSDATGTKIEGLKSVISRQIEK